MALGDKYRIYNLVYPDGREAKAYYLSTSSDNFRGLHTTNFVTLESLVNQKIFDVVTIVSESRLKSKKCRIQLNKEERKEKVNHLIVGKIKVVHTSQNYSEMRVPRGCKTPYFSKIAGQIEKLLSKPEYMRERILAKSGMK